MIVDYEFKLVMFGEPRGLTATVVVENNFRYTDGAGRGHWLGAGENAEEGLAPALKLFRQKCTAASGDDEGRLSLSFADGSRLEAEPHPDAEAWEIPELGLIALPGGGLSLTPKWLS